MMIILVIMVNKLMLRLKNIMIIMMANDEVQGV